MEGAIGGSLINPTAVSTSENERFGAFKNMLLFHEVIFHGVSLQLSPSCIKFSFKVWSGVRLGQP